MTDGLAIIARCDQGGLATQTCDYVKHLRPEWVVAMDLGQAGRGTFDVERLGDLDGAATIRVVRGTEMGLRDIVWLLSRARTVFSAETFYHPQFCEAANEAGVRTILHTNPELHTPDRDGASVILNPSPYMTERFPNLLPVPVPAFRPRHTPTRPRVFMHPTAPASNDRNGTNIVLEALQFIEHDIEVRIIGSRPRHFPTRREMRPKVVWMPPVKEWWEAYEDVDVLVLPRRYAGLSLSCQEAAAFSIPSITLNVEPFSRGYCATTRVGTAGSRRLHMAGGPTPVHEANGAALAMAINAMVDNPQAYQQAVVATARWAAQNTWEKLLPSYLDVILSRGQATTHKENQPMRNAAVKHA